MIETDLEKTKSPAKTTSRQSRKMQKPESSHDRVVPALLAKKNSKKKTKENDEDSDVINTSGPAT